MAMNRRQRKREADHFTIGAFNRTTSPLLALPAELRNQIYAHVSDTVTIAHTRHSTAPYTVHSGSILRRICTQIALESAPFIPRPALLRLEPSVSPYDLLALNARGELSGLSAIQTALLRISTVHVVAADVRVHRKSGVAVGWCGRDGGAPVEMPGLRRVEVWPDEGLRKAIWDEEERGEYREGLMVVFGGGGLEVVFRD
ncbi:hypothetical protein C7974DRAFT_374049 [Boeremia exigua]|uniref:uncharacterized protein n=1 Tax=Boeremia exigua TaxID=749465 RepID=UPI001E8E1F19|nr:uncharacterized protein C7974DRAFT_374049 [Boeremia exigua]KAH6639877.1 hypothetical protein C7974DRAFT_374049 [Boeremia exigua]